MCTNPGRCSIPTWPTVEQRKNLEQSLLCGNVPVPGQVNTGSSSWSGGEGGGQEGGKGGEEEGKNKEMGM